MKRIADKLTMASGIDTAAGAYMHGLAWFLCGCINVAHGVWWMLAMAPVLLLLADMADEWASNRAPTYPLVKDGDVVGEYRVRKVGRRWWR